LGCGWYKIKTSRVHRGEQEKEIEEIKRKGFVEKLEGKDYVDAISSLMLIRLLR